MIHMKEAAIALADSPWQWGIGGLFALAAGLVLVIWPRKSGETWQKITQATSPWPVPKALVGVTIAAGCLFLVIAAVFFYAACRLLLR